MLQTKEFIRRSAMDRRLSLNRRILNLGPKYPDKEQRMKQDRRQGWEDRVEWQRSNPVEPHSQRFNLQAFRLNANLTLADMLSMGSASILNHHIMDYIFFEDHGIYYRHLKDLDTLKSRQVCELRMEKIDGIPFDVQFETTLIVGRCKEPEQYRTVVIDIR